MKKIFYFLFIILAFGCSKDKNKKGGKLVLNMSYSCSQKKNSSTDKNAGTRSGSGTKDAYYTQFGDYITSVTPTRFLCKFLDMRLQNWDKDGSIWNTSINLIDNNSDLANPNRLADFSNNATVELVPDLTNFTTGNDVEFNIFFFSTYFFYQKAELPVQYDTILYLKYLCFGGEPLNFSSFSIGGTRTGRFIEGSYRTFIAPIFDSTWAGDNAPFNSEPKTYVFGGTDSTYLYNSSVGHVSSIGNPAGEMGYIIRSNSYTPIAFQAIPKGDTKTITGTMTFDTNNLLQIYAGKDNIPYTSDDIFVYAPNFWERFTVTLTAN
jgi:hypothetical protein